MDNIINDINNKLNNLKKDIPGNRKVVNRLKQIAVEAADIVLAIMNSVRITEYRNDKHYIYAVYYNDCIEEGKYFTLLNFDGIIIHDRSEVIYWDENIGKWKPGCTSTQLIEFVEALSDGLLDDLSSYVTSIKERIETEIEKLENIVMKGHKEKDGERNEQDKDQKIER